jgi:hypothetical protein
VTNTDSVLAPLIQDLEETISDFRGASFPSSNNFLTRFVHQLDEEPMVSFLAATLRAPDFLSWWKKINDSVGPQLDWPIDRSDRVAMQIALCRAIDAKTVPFIAFVRKFYPSGRSVSDHIVTFSARFLTPLVRDIERLTESRTVSPALFESVSKPLPSGDPLLDSLLADACSKFKDPAPKARAEAAEKLWDAWERLKSLDVQGDKRLSVGQLLDRASPEPVFRAYLEVEAKLLTEIGNKFHIRHFETDQISLSQPEQLDYLFHRLYALIHFLLFSRQRDGNGA